MPSCEPASSGQAARKRARAHACACVVCARRSASADDKGVLRWGDGCSRRAARARALGYRRIGCLAWDERSVLARRGPLGALHAAHSQERTGGVGGTRMLTSSALIVCARRWSARSERAAHRFAPRELHATAGSNVRFSGRETLVEGPGQSNIVIQP
ncbi:hypothetical protein T492DRAFT_1141594 [Pavlovales sp. CCMP2436]|nr:hypothetical protein T492DRAFT_1141594 [Pavlovales sp. CCMP2436]